MIKIWIMMKNNQNFGHKKSNNRSLKYLCQIWFLSSSILVYLQSINYNRLNPVVEIFQPKFSSGDFLKTFWPFFPTSPFVTTVTVFKSQCLFLTFLFVIFWDVILQRVRGCRRERVYTAVSSVASLIKENPKKWFSIVTFQMKNLHNRIDDKTELNCFCGPLRSSRPPHRARRLSSKDSYARVWSLRHEGSH